MIGDIDTVRLDFDANDDSLMKRSFYYACHGKIVCPYLLWWSKNGNGFVSGVLSDSYNLPLAEPSVREGDFPANGKRLCLVNVRQSTEGYPAQNFGINL